MRIERATITIKEKLNNNVELDFLTEACGPQNDSAMYKSLVFFRGCHDSKKLLQ